MHERGEPAPARLGRPPDWHRPCFGPRGMGAVLRSWTGTIAAMASALSLAASAAAADGFSRELTVAPGSTLRIALDRGNVDVLAHDAEDVRVDALARGLGASSIHFDLAPDGKDLVLTGASDEWLTYLQSGPTVQVKVWLPRPCGVDVRTDGGDVRVDGVGGGVVVRTASGSVEVAEVAGPVDVETRRGGIAVDVPAELGAELDALTDGGRVMVEHAVRTRGTLDPGQLRGTINGGGPVLRLRASGGSILVRSD